MLKKMIMTSLLLSSLNVMANQCPPGTALHHQAPSDKWTLDPTYTAQGWQVAYADEALAMSPLTSVPSGMAMFVNLTEFDSVWAERCIYYAPENENPLKKGAIVVQALQPYDTQHVYTPKFIYQPSTLSYVCETTAGDSLACAWV